MRASRWKFLGLTLLAISFLPQSASAYEVYKDEDFSGSVSALVRYALIGQNDNPIIDQIGGNMISSRIQVAGTYQEHIRTVVQYDGVVGLLDAFGEIKNDNVGIRAGRFKTNASGEYIYGLSALPTFRRPELTLISPRRRVGLDVFGAVDLGTVKVRADVGLFNPRGALDIGIDDGQILMERLHVDFKPLFLRLHASFVHHVFSTNLDPVGLFPVFPYDKQVDVALIFDDKEGSRGIVEYLHTIDGPDDTQLFGFYAMVAQEVPVTGFNWEFVLAYDYFNYDNGVDIHRPAFNLNFLVWDRKFVPSLAYMATIRPNDDKVSHTGVLQLQAGF